MTVLGISVGTSRTGVCVIRDGELIACEVHDYPTRWSETKPRVILNQYRHYFERYSVTDVALKVSPLSSQTPYYKRLLRRTVALAKEHRCTFDLIKKDELKGRLRLRSTRQMISFAVRLYPQLKPLHDRDLATKGRFQTRLFEAVVAAYFYGLRKEIAGTKQ